jgi:MFS family permease
MPRFRLKATQATFLLICLMYFILYIDRANIGTAAGEMRREMHLSNTDLGLVFSAFAYPYAAITLFGGWLADRFGARRVFTLYTVCFAAGTLLTGLAGGMTSLLAARALVGLGEGAALSTMTRAMTNWLPRERWGFGQGFTHAFARVATALTPPLIAMLIIATNWRTSFIIVGCSTLVFAAIWYAWFRDDPAAHPGVTPAELARLRPIVKRRPGETIPLKRLGLRLLPLIATFFCYGWTLWVYLTWLPTFFLQQFHMDLKSSALFSGGILLGGVLGDAVGGMLSDFLYRRTGRLEIARSWQITVGLLLTFVSLCTVLVTTDLTAVALALTVALFFLEIAVGPLWLCTMDIAPAYAGTAGGYLSIGFAAAGILSPLCFGVLVDLSGSWQTPFAMSIGLLLVGAVLARWLKPDQPFEDRPSDAPALAQAKAA